MRVTASAKQRLVRGEYNRNGYEVWLGNRLVYSAGNHIHDSSQPALCAEDRLPLATLRKFCIKTARDLALEHGGLSATVERVAEEEQLPAQ